MTDKPEQFQLKWKAVAVVMIMVCASVLMTAYAMGSGSGGNSIPVVIESGSGVETASYIIYKDGDYTCAKNGTTGRIEYRSENTSYVLNSVLALDSSNIYVTQGDYDVDYCIVIVNNDTRITGQNAVFTYPSDTDGIYAESLENIVIKGLAMIGGGSATGTTGLGINFLSCNNVTVAECYMSAWRNDCVIFHGPNSENCVVEYCRIIGTREGPEFKGVTNSVARYNYIENVVESHIEITDRDGIADASYISVYGNTFIEGNTFHNVWLYGNVSYISVYDNTIKDSDAAGIVWQQKFAYSVASNLFIHDNVITGCAQGVRIIHTGTSNVYIEGNKITGATTFGIYLQAAVSRLTIHENAVYNTIGATSDGIKFAAPCPNATVTNNIVNTAGRYGMVLQLSNGVVSGNSIFGTVSYGINFEVGVGNSVSYNRINGFGLRGIALSSGVTNNTFMANTITGGPTGLYGGSGAIYNYAIGNVFKGCTSAGYALSGAGCVNDNNTGI